MASTSRQFEKAQTRKSLFQNCSKSLQQKSTDNYSINNGISTIITTTRQKLVDNQTRSSLRSLPEQNLQKMLRKLSNVDGLRKGNVKKNFRKFSLQVTSGIQEHIDEKGK